jgi:hypothetical protein
VVLLGPRAIDGLNKRKRSQSRARKFAVMELSGSLLAFFATVVRLSKWSTTLNTDGPTKLYFLLGKSTMFSEDDDQFRDFFENRYISLAEHLPKSLPQTFRVTMEWLNNEVFVQQDDEQREVVDSEQYAFEAELDEDIQEAKKAYRHRREQAIAEMRSGE